MHQKKKITLHFFIKKSLIKEAEAKIPTGRRWAWGFPVAPTWLSRFPGIGQWNPPPAQVLTGWYRTPNAALGRVPALLNVFAEEQPGDCLCIPGTGFRRQTLPLQVKPRRLCWHVQLRSYAGEQAGVGIFSNTSLCAGSSPKSVWGAVLLTLYSLFLRIIGHWCTNAAMKTA